MFDTLHDTIRLVEVYFSKYNDILVCNYLSFSLILVSRSNHLSFDTSYITIEPLQVSFFPYNALLVCCNLLIFLSYHFLHPILYRLTPYTLQLDHCRFIFFTKSPLRSNPYRHGIHCWFPTIKKNFDSILPYSIFILK